MAPTPVERKRVNDAVGTLAGYNKAPFITDFLKKQPKPRIPPGKYEKDELCGLITQILLGEYRGKKKYALKLDELMNYLDLLQETGRQHVYLFRLPEKEREQLLPRLRVLDDLKSLLGVEEALYKEGGQFVWEARGSPQLAFVRQDPADVPLRPRRLVLKWVETREYWAPLKTDSAARAIALDNEETVEEQEFEGVSVIHQIEPSKEVLQEGETRSKVAVKELREERATTFFVINLDNGECELRIQALRSQARRARQEQLATYRSLVMKLFKVELEGPTVLAPAIRRLLLTREVPIVHCAAILPDGGTFQGKEGEFPPVDVGALQAGLAIGFEWSQPDAGVGRIDLDGRLDEISIRRPLLPKHHHRLLEEVRSWHRQGLTTQMKPTGAGTGSVTGIPSKPETLPPAAEKTLFQVLIAALKRAKPEPAALHREINRATLEYVRTHAGEEGTGAAPARGEAQKLLSGDDHTHKQLVTHIKEVAESQSSIYQRDLKLIRSEERSASRLFVAAATLALCIVVVGAILLFAKEPVSGAITSLLGALTGGGTILIRDYANRLKEKRELIEGWQRDNQSTITLIQIALAIENANERSQAMRGIVSTLLGHIQLSSQNPTRAPTMHPSSGKLADSS